MNMIQNFDMFITVINIHNFISKPVIQAEYHMDIMHHLVGQLRIDCQQVDWAPRVNPADGRPRDEHTKFHASEQLNGMKWLAPGTSRARHHHHSLILGAGHGGCGTDATAPVGSLPGGASPFGVLDMAGNAWEWTADYWGPRYYRRSPTKNPKGPAKGVQRVMRGGSWSRNARAKINRERTAMMAMSRPSFKTSSWTLSSEAGTDIFKYTSRRILNGEYLQ